MKIKDSEVLGYALYKKLINTKNNNKTFSLVNFRQGAIAKSKFK